MTVPKWILFGSVTLFSVIGITAFIKRGNRHPSLINASQSADHQMAIARSETPIVSVPLSHSHPILPPEVIGKKKSENMVPARPVVIAKEDFPSIDRIFQLFSTSSSKLPIVETITYTSSVSWLKGRPAWIADYATHFNTSRHFIARSLNGKPDYFSQKVSEGSRFNVFRRDKNIQFFLLVDVSRCKMGFYYIDLDTNERVLLKTYQVGLGRLDASKPSGTLTPLGRYAFGERVAIYQPGMTGFYQDQKVEMMQVFGTRWIPLDREVERTTASAKGYGVQGAPWRLDKETHQLLENRSVIGAYDSDGCIRMYAEDIEELFSIVLTKPTFIEIVKNFHEAKLPGTEVAVPSR